MLEHQPKLHKYYQYQPKLLLKLQVLLAPCQKWEKLSISDFLSDDWIKMGNICRKESLIRDQDVDEIGLFLLWWFHFLLGKLILSSLREFSNIEMSWIGKNFQKRKADQHPKSKSRQFNMWTILRWRWGGRSEYYSSFGSTE